MVAHRPPFPSYRSIRTISLYSSNIEPRNSNPRIFTSFTDPHPLTPLESHRFKNRGEGCHLSSCRVPVNPIECAVPKILLASSLECADAKKLGGGVRPSYLGAPHPAQLRANILLFVPRLSTSSLFSIFPYILPSYVCSKFFTCHSYEKRRGGTPCFPFWDWSYDTHNGWVVSWASRSARARRAWGRRGLECGRERERRPPAGQQTPSCQ